MLASGSVGKARQGCGDIALFILDKISCMLDGKISKGVTACVHRPSKMVVNITNIKL